MLKTFVTSEPYIGHLGLGSVGDIYGMLESAVRNCGMKWVTNANVSRVNPRSVEVLDVPARVQARRLPAFGLIDPLDNTIAPKAIMRHGDGDFPKRLRAG